MTEYNIQRQRDAAIKTLKSKMNELHLFILTGRFTPRRQNTDYTSWDKDSLNEMFHHHCEKVRNGHQYDEYQLQWIKNNPKSALALAFKYVKLEELIKRLESGEDPALILLEVVSSND